MTLLPRSPLLRLLAVNLAIGVAIAVLAVVGLIALDVHGLRRLILVDEAPVATIGLLLFGFVITFGSVAMGTAIMMLPRGNGRQGGAKARCDGGSVPVQVRIDR